MATSALTLKKLLTDDLSAIDSYAKSVGTNKSQIIKDLIHNFAQELDRSYTRWYSHFDATYPNSLDNPAAVEFDRAFLQDIAQNFSDDLFLKLVTDALAKDINEYSNIHTVPVIGLTGAVRAGISKVKHSWRRGFRYFATNVEPKKNINKYISVFYTLASRELNLTIDSSDHTLKTMYTIFRNVLKELAVKMNRIPEWSPAYNESDMRKRIIHFFEEASKLVENREDSDLLPAFLKKMPVPHTLPSKYDVLSSPNGISLAPIIDISVDIPIVTDLVDEFQLDIIVVKQAYGMAENERLLDISLEKREKIIHYQQVKTEVVKSFKDVLSTLYYHSKANFMTDLIGLAHDVFSMKVYKEYLRMLNEVHTTSNTRWGDLSFFDFNTNEAGHFQRLFETNRSFYKRSKFLDGCLLQKHKYYPLYRLVKHRVLLENKMVTLEFGSLEDIFKFIISPPKHGIFNPEPNRIKTTIVGGPTL